MTYGSQNGSAPSPADRDHEEIRRILGSKEWEHQLEVARAQRAKALAERERQKTGSRGFSLDQDNGSPVPIPDWLLHKTFQSPSSLTPVEEPKLNSKNVRDELPVATGRRAFFGLAIGLAAGFVTGVAWRPLFDVLQAMPESSQAVRPNLLTPVASRPAAIDPRRPAIDPMRADASSRPVLSFGGEMLHSSMSDPTWLRMLPTDPTTQPLPKQAEEDLSYPASLLPKAASLPFDSRLPDLYQTAMDKSAVPLMLPSLLEGIVNVTGDQTANSMPDPAQHFPNIPDASTYLDSRLIGRAPILVQQSVHDAPPLASSSVYVHEAESYRLNLHTAPDKSEPTRRAQLVDMGFVYVSVAPTTFAASQSLVAFYHAEDGGVARTLARQFDGSALDMTGFVPAPNERTLDIYLIE